MLVSVPRLLILERAIHGQSHGHARPAIARETAEVSPADAGAAAHDGGAGAGGLAAVLAGARGEVLEATGRNGPVVRSLICVSYEAV